MSSHNAAERLLLCYLAWMWIGHFVLTPQPVFAAQREEEEEKDAAEARRAEEQAKLEAEAEKRRKRIEAWQAQRRKVRLVALGDSGPEIQACTLQAY